MHTPNFTVSRVDLLENLPEIGRLIRTSYADVAAQFNITRENCASHPAFQADDLLLAKLNLPLAIHLAAHNSDGEIIGFAAATPTKKHVVEGLRFCVLPAYQGLGLGNMLLDKLLHELRQGKVRSLEVGLIDANEPLKAWYLRRGFVQTGKREYAGVPFVVCRMQLKL
ncbi:MAG: GNAT family N-acetyltransferase [Oscillospiraceae bacterium]|nr:GNAT family N-acetyltransferase [Oscillospiraceae bacterium]